MSSRVLTTEGKQEVRPIHWAMALGVAVNASPQDEAAQAGEDSPTRPEPEIDAALQRIQVLERRIQELEQDLPRKYESGRAEGYKLGREQGIAEGSAEASQHWNPLLERLSQTIADLGTFRARFRRESEPELLKLSMAVAKKILRREVSVDPFALLGVLKAALESINQAELLQVRLHPTDSETLKARIEEMELPASVAVLGDPAIARGEIRVETKRGTVEAGIQAQLAEIENGFADRTAPGRKQ